MVRESTEAPDSPTAAAGAKYRHETSTSPSAEEISEFKVACLMNARYHATREAFLDTVHRWLMFGVIVFGAGAIGELLKIFNPPTWLPGLFAAIAATFGALDLTFDLSNRARSHTMMKRRYWELLAEVEGGQKTLKEGQACLHRFAADEEPPYHALLATCYNSAMEMIHGDDGDRYDIPRSAIYLQNVLRFDGSKYNLKPKAIP